VTRPVDVPLRRHVGALLGQLVLDAVRGLLRTVVAVLLVAAVVVASWSFLAPRVADRLAQLRAQTVSEVKNGVTPDVPTQDLRGWLDTITRKSARDDHQETCQEAPGQEGPPHAAPLARDRHEGPVRARAGRVQGHQSGPRQEAGRLAAANRTPNRPPVRTVMRASGSGMPATRTRPTSTQPGQ